MMLLVNEVLYVRDGYTLRTRTWVDTWCFVTSFEVVPTNFFFDFLKRRSTYKLLELCTSIAVRKSQIIWIFQIILSFHLTTYLYFFANTQKPLSKWTENRVFVNSASFPDFMQEIIEMLSKFTEKKQKQKPRTKNISGYRERKSERKQQKSNEHNCIYIKKFSSEVSTTNCSGLSKDLPLKFDLERSRWKVHKILYC